MPFSSDVFYLQEPPSLLQQGDIVAGVPLMLLPPLNALVLIRQSHHRLPLEGGHLKPGEVTLVDERVLSDVFETGSEYAAVSVQRGLAMLITPTCDLEQDDGVWATWPLRPIDGSGLDVGNLDAGKFTNLYRLPDHRHFEGMFVDMTDIRPVRPQQFPLRDRVASTTRLGLDEILRKFHGALGRIWGYGEGEIIEQRSKHETGKFRCAACNLYDIPVSEQVLKPGDSAPTCENCKKIKRHPQWYPLSEHRKN